MGESIKNESKRERLVGVGGGWREKEGGWELVRERVKRF
jgi:hypothetical protein